MEESQKRTAEDILEFGKRMDARWNELKESLNKVNSKNQLSTKTQSDSAEKVLVVHGKTKEKLADSVFDNSIIGC